MKEKILAANDRFTRKVMALLDELAHIDAEKLNRKPANGGWSAIQTLHHLVLVEENSLAYVRKKLSFNPALEKPGMLSGLRMLVLRIGLSLPVKYKAPQSAGSERIPETSTLDEVRTQWQKIRQDWDAFFHALSEETAKQAVYRHPRAGRIGWLQMLDFFNLHFDRHRLQVRRALS